jgi:hypothetical protein
MIQLTLFFPIFSAHTWGLLVSSQQLSNVLKSVSWWMPLTLTLPEAFQFPGGSLVDEKNSRLVIILLWVSLGGPQSLRTQVWLR